MTLSSRRPAPAARIASRTGLALMVALAAMQPALGVVDPGSRGLVAQVNRKLLLSRKLDALRRCIAKADATNAAVWPAPMASPPIITAGATNAASTLNSATISAPAVYASDARITWLGGNPATNANVAIANARVGSSVNFGAATRGANLNSVQFYFSGSAFEIAWVRANTQYSLWVDGVPVSASDLNSAAASGTYHYDKVDFGSVSVRKIRIDWPGATATTNQDTLIGINFATGGTIFAAPPAEKLRGMIVGDSYTQAGQGSGYGTSRVAGSFASGLGRLLGIEDWWRSGVGGSGVINPGSYNIAWPSRLADIGDFQPDVLFFELSVNDNPSTAAAIQAAYATYFTQVQAAAPNALIFVLGPPNPTGKLLTSAQEQAMIAGVNAVADRSRTFVIDSFSPQPPFTGNGNATTTNGTGNQDYYVQSDNIHPNQAGHDYLARWWMMKVRALVFGL